MANYFTLLTKIGQAKVANAIALNTSVSLTHMAVGDGLGNPTTPNENQTALLREKFRASINQLTIDPSNPNYLICELVIPTTQGGWAVNEVGVFDSSGNLFAVANFPATYKPQLAEGSGRDLVIRIYIQVSNAAVVNLMVDPAVVLASQAWVIANFSRAKILPGGLTGQVLAKNSNADGDTKWIDPTAAVNVVVASVEETQTLAANQLIVDAATVTTNALAVFIEGVRLRNNQFTVNSATRITLAQSYNAGTKITLVQNAQTGVSLLARKDGADFTGPVTVPQPPQFDNDTSVATTAFVKQSGVQHSAPIITAVSRTLTAAEAAGNFIVISGATAAVSITLPPSSGMLVGAVVSFLNASAFPLTITRGGTDAINIGSGNAVNSITVQPGGSVSMTSITANSTNWQCYAGTACNATSAEFGASLAANGFAKSANGTIIQWGNSVTSASADVPIVFPIAFTAAPYIVIGTIQSNVVGYAVSVNTFTNTGAYIGSYSASGTRASATTYWFAIGK